MTEYADAARALAADGFVTLKGFFSDDMRHDLARRGAQVADGVRAGGLQRSGQFCTGLENSWFEPLIHNPRILDYVTSVLGPDVCIVTWRVVMKDPVHFNGPINIHQDWPYFGGGPTKLNIFIPLSTVSRANGAMIFFRGSHHLGPLVRGDIDAKRYPELEDICPELQVGDLLAADFLTWHSSGPADIAEDRIMVQMVFQPASDPSSKHVVTGEIRNPSLCQSPFDPMREPLTQLNTRVAMDYLNAGDLQRAERFARGAFASDASHGAAALLMYDILKAKGSDEADAYLEHARVAARSLTEALQARTQAEAERVSAESDDPKPRSRPRIASIIRSWTAAPRQAARKG